MVVPKRDVVPALGAELPLSDPHGTAIELAAIPRQDPFDLTVEQEDVVFRAAIGLERRRIAHVGHGEDRQIVLVKRDALR